MATETTKLTYVEGAAASTPAASRVVTYSKSDGLMYSKDDAGAETLMSGGAGGAPSTADYLVGTANGSLSAEIVVGTTPGGELGGTWGTPTVDTLHSGSVHIPSILLDFPLATDHSNVALTGGTALDVIANQNFTKARAGSLIEVVVRGFGFCNDATNGEQNLCLIVIDSAGTPVTKYLSAATNTSIVANTRNNVLAGGTVHVSGLTAAVHTIKVQILSLAADHFYCRASTAGPPTNGVEFCNVQVIEHG